MLILIIMSFQRLGTNCCSRNNINFFVFTERKLEPKQASRASGCPQSSGSLQWEQYRDHCYAFDMAFYNFSVYNVEEAKRICKKLSRFRLFITLQLVIEVHYLRRNKTQHPKILHWLYFSFAIFMLLEFRKCNSKLYL